MRIDDATPEELETCPFCETREDRTPPETLALPHREPPDSPRWAVRVVPNLYPAFERQEVVVHSPRHVRSFAELDDEQIALVAAAWQARREAEPGGYLHALINEGRAAGASLAHSHSQLVWMEESPPAVTRERDVGATMHKLLETVHARPHEFEIELLDEMIAFCPPAPRVPYETIITNAYVRDAMPFESNHLAAGLTVLRNVVRRLRDIEGGVPWNAWLHAGGNDWHIELVPRLTVLAGVELGAEIYVNTVAPEEAAARLRAAQFNG